ncbi:MAG: Spy/CpxP family protein refolding chaperone [Acidobacteriota bacterium]|nr:Spy/CpxP family protein refolding chaperone [Acidobacteriota bacterium]
MNNLKFGFLLIFSLLFFAFPDFIETAKAQEPSFPQPVAQGQRRGRQLIRLLNLSPEQIEQIRAINQETREQIRQAVQKQREARRALDLAIYADNPNAAEVEQRTRAFGEVQAEVSRLRARTEFRIRQVLTPEQLARFRELRRRSVETPMQQQQPAFAPPPQNRPKRLPVKNRPQF